MLNILQRQRQAAVLTMVPPLQQQAAMLVALQRQNAVLNAGLQQQQNALRNQDGQRPPRRPQKPRQQQVDLVAQRNEVQTPDPDAPGFVVIQPKQSK
jgi:hypothetical protein